MDERQLAGTADPWAGNGRTRACSRSRPSFSGGFLHWESASRPAVGSLNRLRRASPEKACWRSAVISWPTGVLSVKLELARAPRDVRVGIGVVMQQLSQLDERCRLLPLVEGPQPDQISLWCELRVAALPMSLSRESTFVSGLDRIDALAVALQNDLPSLATDDALATLYEPHGEYLELIEPGQLRDSEITPDLDHWAGETLDYLEGAASVALIAGSPLLRDFAMAVLAHKGRPYNMTFGQIKTPMITSKALVDLATKAPGVIVVPAPRLSLATSHYELAGEAQSMLSVLSQGGHSAIFTGSYAELQEIFSGGQGGVNDPLHPVLSHVPDAATPMLCRYAVRSVGRKAGGLPPAVEDELTRDVMAAVEHHSPGVVERTLATVAARAVYAWAAGKNTTRAPISTFAKKVGNLNQTLGGLSDAPRALRAGEVQDRYVEVLTSPELFDYLAQRLLAQDAALRQLTSRLRMECLTRPLHQPYRYCAQGTPGTGKSESAVLLAQRLGIPYVNIDAASMSDHYTAAAQLLGSGRGIVGSYQSGRLEQAAKHHRGALVEVSDLDHAIPSVRSALADLFLQILETGEGQSAAGAMFSCANLTFAFTMNLPDGTDETLRRNIGFNHAPTRRDIGQRVEQEIKRMLSGAFLSRVGTPILFEPLDGSALAAILERAIKAALVAAADRMRLELAGVSVEEGLGTRLLTSLEANITSMGARSILEHGRSLVAQAFLDLLRSKAEPRSRVLHVSLDRQGHMTIQPQ